MIGEPMFQSNKEIENHGSVIGYKDSALEVIGQAEGQLQSRRRL
jgi:hypothetical protein